MSAAHAALIAALEYADRMEKRVEELKAKLRESEREKYLLQSQLRKVRRATDPQDCEPCGPGMAMHGPMGLQPEEEFMPAEELVPADKAKNMREDRG